MPAIDYMQLLREEKRKQRKKKSQSSSSSKTTTNTKKKDDTTMTMTMTEEANEEEVGNNYNSNGDDNVRRQDGESSTTTTSNTTASCNNIIPEWSYPNTEFEFSSNFRGAGGLKVICDNPKRISYCSSHALFGVENSNTTLKKLSDWLISLPSGNTGLNCWKTMKYGKRRVAMFGEICHDPSSKLLPQPLQQIANQLVINIIFTSHQPPNHVLLNDYQPSQGILGHTDGPLYINKTATISLNSDVLLIFTKRRTSNEIGGSIQSHQSQNHQSQNNNNNKKDTTADGTNVSSSSTIYSNEDQQQQKSTKDDKEQSINNTTDPSPSPPPPQPATSSRSNIMEVLLEAGSLIVFEDDAYINYCHGIKMDVFSDITTSACLNAQPGIVIPRGRRFSLTFRHKPPPPTTTTTSSTQPQQQQS